MAKHKYLFISLFLVAILSVILYIFLWYFLTDLPVTRKAFMQIVNRKSIHSLAIVVAAISIASSSLVFQTSTQNRILTPGIIGFDAIYVCIQTLIVFHLGSSHQFFNNKYINFMISTLVMILISLIMYRLVLRKNRNNLVLLLLLGMVVSTFARSFTGYIQVIMNPDELNTVIGSSIVSITNINTNIAYLASFMLIGLFVFFLLEVKTYDIMALGEENAINLGVNYNLKNTYYMILIAIAMAISTALIGPITFLGLIAVNLARELIKDSKHLPLLILSCLIALISLLLGQLLVEQLSLNISVTVVLNLIGGLYMIYLILRVNRQ